MKSLVVLALLFAWLAGSVQELPDSAVPILVDASWVSDHLNDPGLVVLQISGSRREYLTGHIPGARFLWPQWLSPSTPDGTYETPPPAYADSIMGLLGIHPTSRIILCYTGGMVTGAARMYLTFRYLGLGDRVSILNGGLDAWKAGGRTVSRDVPQFKHGTYKSVLRKDVFVDADAVRRSLKDPGVAIIDAREHRFYAGLAGGYPRLGHISGPRTFPSQAWWTPQTKSRTSPF